MSQGMHSRISEMNRVRSYDTRQSRGALRTALSGPTPKAMIDKFAILPISACVFALVVSPLLDFFTDLQTRQIATLAAEASPENRIFWPAVAAISVILAVQNRSRLGRLTWPPHIICLLAYLA